MGVVFLTIAMFALTMAMAFLLANVAKEAGWPRIAVSCRLLGAFLVFCAAMGALTALINCADRFYENPAKVPQGACLGGTIDSTGICRYPEMPEYRDTTHS